MKRKKTRPPSVVKQAVGWFGLVVFVILECAVVYGSYRVAHSILKPNPNKIVTRNGGPVPRDQLEREAMIFAVIPTGLVAFGFALLCAAMTGQTDRFLVLLGAKPSDKK